MANPRRNLERKARCPNLDWAFRAIQPLGVSFLAREIQTDTYFHVQSGRLKLREIEGQAATLIHYDRPDRAEARLSNYRLVPVADAPGLKAALADGLGVRGVVRKARTIHLWHNVRIHFDEVDQLGSYVEFEAVLGPEDDLAIAQERLAELARVLKINAEDWVVGSYVDLLGI